MDIHNAQLMRRATILEGKVILKQGYEDYLKYGHLTYKNNVNVQVSLVTNDWFYFDATRYRYVIAVQFAKSYGNSLLVMTTNQTFIWIDEKGTPEIVGGDSNSSMSHK